MPTAHLAIDFGASSGRAMLGVLQGEPKKISLTEVHRFEHTILSLPSGPVWDLTSLWRELLVGLRRGAIAARELGLELATIGVNSWAVDWVLVEPSGELLGLPHAYRDPVNEAAKRRVLARLPGGIEALYRSTGIQPQPFNTLFQIDARRHASPHLFDETAQHAQLLMLPDLFHFWLSGVRTCERTNASSTAMLNVASRDWDRQLLETLSLPHRPLQKLIDPGTAIGSLRRDLAEELDIRDELLVIAPATHDTASAVAAVPATEEQGWAYLSSGTWSLLGVEIDEAITSDAALAIPFTNELGVAGRVRFLRNIAGLWLIQQLRHDLAQQGQTFDFARLANLAKQAQPLRTLVNPNESDLAQPGGIIAKLQRHARKTAQPEPTTPGELARCCLESLALCYAETVDQIESLTSRSVDKLYVVGGGVQNDLLNRLTAQATNRTINVGPSEATAIGNALVQAMGIGLIADLKELREVVARSFPATMIEPIEDEIDWPAARRRYEALVRQSLVALID